MAVVEKKVPCPSCEEVVEVKLDDGKKVVGADVGHSDADDALNQLCTSCMQKIHVKTT